MPTSDLIGVKSRSRGVCAGLTVNWHKATPLLILPDVSWQLKAALFLRNPLVISRRMLGIGFITVSVCSYSPVSLAVKRGKWQSKLGFFFVRYKFQFRTSFVPIPVAARCKARVCGRSLTGFAGSNPAGGMYVSCACCVLSSRGVCVSLITRPEES